MVGIKLPRRRASRARWIRIAPPIGRVSNLKRMKDSLADVLGPRGRDIATAMQAGLRFLDGADPGKLLDRTGDVIAEVPAFEPIDKSALPASYGGSQTGPSDDFLAGRGLFYLSEQRR